MLNQLIITLSLCLTNQLKTPISAKLVTITEQAAQKYHVNPDLLHAIIIQESRYQTTALNDKVKIFSYGLGQLTVDTAMHHCKIRKENIYDPKLNVNCAAKVLAYQVKRYDGNYAKALSAYNAGTAIKGNYDYVAGVMGHLDTVLKCQNNHLK